MDLDVNSVAMAKSGGDLSTNTVVASAVSGDAAGEDEGEVRAVEPETPEPIYLFPPPLKQMGFSVHALEL